MTSRRALTWTLIGSLLAGGAALAVQWSSWTVPIDAAIPTARVVRGALPLDVHLTGELRARRSVTLTPPPAGAPLRLVRMAETGTAVKAGDLVMEFDPGEQQHALEQSLSELVEAEQEIVKMRADAEVQAAQAQVDLLTARFDLQRAEMDAAADQTLIGAVEAQKRTLAVEEARRRLEELEQREASSAATDRAALTSLEERRNKARLAAGRARQIIERLAVPSPIDGLAERCATSSFRSRVRPSWSTTEHWPSMSVRTEASSPERSASSAAPRPSWPSTGFRKGPKWRS